MTVDGRVSHVLLIFLDGIGLGAEDPASNPFAVANTPTLRALAGGSRWLASTPRTESERAIFLPTDPRLGVAGAHKAPPVRPPSSQGETSRRQSASIMAHGLPRRSGPFWCKITCSNA